MEKTLLFSDLMCLVLLVYLIFVVYVYQRQKPITDFRVVIMLISLANAIFCAVMELFLDFRQRLPLFFFYDIIRFSTLFSMSFLYASIVTKNLLPQRKNILNGLRVFFWVVILLMGFIGGELSLKLKKDSSYSRILCTDPALLYLRFGPFLSSIFFAIIIKMIKNKVVEGPNYLKIDEARKFKRL